MSNLIRRFEQWWCRHPHQIHRKREGRWYLECLSCGHQSKGIQIER